MKKRIMLLFIITSVLLTACGAGQIDELNARIEELEKEVNLLEYRISTKDEKITELTALVEEAAPWFEISEEERKVKAAAFEEEKRVAEEAERLAAEEAERVGYNTGITFNQLARNPDDYEGQKVKFYGQVVQIMEGSRRHELRLAVNGNYDNIIYTTYLASEMNLPSRILEDDFITIYGIANGLKTYETVMGSTLTIPYITIDSIEQ